MTIDQLVDICDLPVYGGNEPEDTYGIWSWDETRILVGDDGKWCIEAR